MKDFNYFIFIVLPAVIALNFLASRLVRHSTRKKYLRLVARAGGTVETELGLPIYQNTFNGRTVHLRLSSNNRATWTIARSDLPHPCAYRIVIRSGGFTTVTPEFGMEKVITGFEDFDKEFRVYSSDTAQALSIVTPDLCDWCIRLRDVGPLLLRTVSARSASTGKLQKQFSTASANDCGAVEVCFEGDQGEQPLLELCNLTAAFASALDSLPYCKS